MRQREEASKYDENVTVKRSAGRKLLVEKVQECTRTCGGAGTIGEEGSRARRRRCR